MTIMLRRLPDFSLLAAVFLITGLALMVSACSDTGLEAVNEAPPPSPSATDGPVAKLNEPGDEDVFVIVEEMPELIGGLAAVAEQVTYTPIAKRAGVEGRVYLQFIVSKEGVPEDIKVTRGVGAGLDEAAVDAVSKVRFIPGRQRGQAVRVKMSLPVTFRLDDGAAKVPVPPRPE